MKWKPRLWGGEDLILTSLPTDASSMLPSIAGGAKMRFEKFSFGSIRIDGVTHKQDVVKRPS
jgi:hypothetical protein